MFEGILGALGLSKGATIGGFLGALVSLKFVEQLNIWQGATTVFAGMAAAAYVTPLLVTKLFEWDKATSQQESAVAFLIGVFGMAIGAAILKAIPVWIDAFSAKIGGPK